MNLDHDFAQVWKFSEDQGKKCKWNTFSPRIQVKTKKKRSSSKIEHFFFPNSGEDQKKKVFIKNRALFSPNFRSDINPFKILGGCRCGPFSNYWGEAKLLGGYIPPGFGTPVCELLLDITLLSMNNDKQRYSNT